MNKDEHDIDDLFRSALDAYEETPSARVKESLETALDKKDAKPYKRKVAGWKRTAFLLLMLFLGFVIYESGILKKSSGRSGQRAAGKQLNYSSAEKNKETYQNDNVSGNTINYDPNSYNSEAIKSNDNNSKTATGDEHTVMLPKQKEITVAEITGTKNEAGYEKENWGIKSLVNQKNNPEKEQSHSITEAEKKQAHGFKPNPVKNIDGSLKTEDPLPSEKTNRLQSLNEMNITKMVAELTNSIKQLQTIKDSILKSSITNNTKAKKIKLFRPFWMLNAFVSYEGAGYRLDSDIPGNITSIKHSEVQEPSFSLGILITRQLRKLWGLQSGFVYSQTDIGITPQKLFALQDPGGDIAFKYVTSSGYAYIKPGLGSPPAIGDSLNTTEGKHRLKSVTVPLAVKYSVGKNRLTFNPGLGIEANFLTSAKVEIEIESPSSPEVIFINKLNGAKRFYVSVVADAELRYKLNNKLSASFRPTLRFATSPITENNVVETFPRSVGLGMGLSLKF